MIKLRIKLDIDKDAWNWWDACNKVSFGMDWKQRIKPELREQIVGKTQKEANLFLIPYLENLYKKKDKKISKFIGKTKKIFDEKLENACVRIESVMGRPIYRKDFTLYFTMFPRAPYNPKTGSIWLSYRCKDPVGLFFHELCHFQFIYYWRNKNTNVKKLPLDQFEFLKESLTVILDKDFLDIIEEEDDGYPIHKEFRSILKKHWQNNHKFEELVEYGLKNIDKFCSRLKN